jgi:serine/threonine-protein kinase HipA
MTDRLEVHLRNEVVADLVKQSSKDLELQYRGNARPHIDALSLALPVRSEPYSDAECRNVFDWVLPEKQVRENMARRAHADSSDTFSLLAEYGRECAGALQFVDPAATVAAAPSVKWLDKKEFAAKLHELSTHPFLSYNENEVELSLGGVQEKALVVIGEDGRIGLPMHGEISTHIVKPDISDRLRSVLPEFFALQLAKSIEMSVAESIIEMVDGRLVLFVKRFDRLVEVSGAVRREHHETMAQALNVSPADKYELRGGPGVVELANLVRSVSGNVVRDLQKLTTLLVFNAIIGNADAHVGNFGLIHYANGVTRMSPAYDLVPVRAILGKNPKGYAMSIGGSFEFGNLNDARMIALGRELGVAPRGVVATWNDMRSRIPDAAIELAAEIRAGHSLSEPDDKMLTTIVDDIIGRCN